MAPRRIAFLSAVLLAASASASLWPFGKGDNIHEVVPGALYRSAQLDAKTLTRTIRKDHLASVLNLRGGGPGDRVYDDEVEACRRLNVVHADVPMSATRLPRPSELVALFAAFDRLPRPLLVHCQQGKDRTGLAVALYETLYNGMPIDEAKRKGLSKRYGHTGHGKAAAMDRFVDLYRRTGGDQDLRTWIDRSYPALYAGKA